MKYSTAALNTIAANPFTILFAKLFGVKHIGFDSDGSVVIMSYWRGKYYLTDWKQGELK